jgi:hypothetical protein
MSRIFRKLRTWRGGGYAAVLLGGLLASTLAPAPTSAQSVAEKQQMLKDRKSLFNLAAGPDVLLSVNKMQCGATSEGETCVDTFGSPTGGGGFWPTGTPDQYMFSSGLQVSGIIPVEPGCGRLTTDPNPRHKSNTPTCFHWSGDTTAALFFEGSGNLHHGTPVTSFYNSLDPEDLATWPEPGSVPDFPEATSMIINDTALFNSVLIGRKAASQQDSWVAYWDGNPGKSGGRTHPMGILAEQRTLAWNYPSGNEATIYLIYRLTNVTNNPLFQQVNEARYFGGLDSLPNAGWRFDSVFVAYAADPDVGPATNNQASGILPFSMAITYETSFNDPAFVYPPDEFHAPFFPRSPGIVGMKFLKSPTNPLTGQQLGLTALSLVTNGGAFPDASSVGRAWRYMSLNTTPTYNDAACSFPLSQVKVKRACYLGQVKADVRVFMASGPMSLEPGQSATIAASVMAAAAVATPLIGTSPTSDNPPGIPSLQPGCGSNTVRPIEVASGWLTTKVCPQGDTTAVVKQQDVTVVPGSLLGKALVAQSIFDNKFLLGFSPEPPDFFLVPGNNTVTVVWEPSKTEQTGDPFFAAAGNPTNALFNPNYRQFDVEGYRIYRGSKPGDLQLIAQFDKKGSTFTDVLCATDPSHVTGAPCTDTHVVELNGEFVQVETVAQLQNGDPILLKADTALATEIRAGTSKPLSDTGIPFAFIDTQVRNGFQYFYKVTAFDINSLRSGPSSLESAAPVESVIPRAASGALSQADFSVGIFGRANSPLNPSATSPSIDPAKGTFSGPALPATGLTGTFNAFATQLLAAGAKEIRIDSVQGQYYANGTIATYYLSVDNTPVVHTFSIEPVNGSGGGTETFELPVLPFASDPAVRSQLQLQGVDAPGLAGSVVSTLTVDRPHFGSQNADWAPKQPGFWSPDPDAASCAGGSRWFEGANETMADPALGVKAHGQLTGMTIFEPIPYANQVLSATCTPNVDASIVLSTYKGQVGDIMRRFYGTTFGVTRAADVKIFWGAGKVDSVIDVTHNVAVPYQGSLSASYGFLKDADADGVLTYGDFYYIPGLQNTGNIGGFSTATPVALAAQPVVMNTDINGNLTGDATGFGLYINGEPWLFGGAVPTNTVWTLRTYQGSVVKSSAGVYSFTSLPRNAPVPGLRLRAQVVAPAVVIATNADLKQVHTVPDPYYGVSLFDLGPANKELQFVNLPPQATIRIYSLAGVLVDVLNHTDPTGGGVARWDLRNRSNQFVASGVYMFHVSTPEGKSATGKFTVVSSGLGQ